MSVPEEYMDWIEKNAEAENYPDYQHEKFLHYYGEGCSGPPES